MTTPIQYYKYFVHILSSCRVTCKTYDLSKSTDLDRIEPVACCIKGSEGKVGQCRNGRCRSVLIVQDESKQWEYRKLAIKVKQVSISVDKKRLEKLRVKIKYIKPAGDQQGSYDDDDILCETDLVGVKYESSDNNIQVRFDTLCKTLLVHRHASFKFIAEDDSPEDKRITFEGVEKLARMTSGYVKLGSHYRQDILDYELKIFPSSDGSRVRTGKRGSRPRRIYFEPNTL